MTKKILRNRKTGKYLNIEYGDSLMVWEVDDPAEARTYSKQDELSDDDLKSILDDVTYFELNGEEGTPDDILLEVLDCDVVVTILD